MSEQEPTMNLIQPTYADENSRVIENIVIPLNKDQVMDISVAELKTLTADTTPQKTLELHQEADKYGEVEYPYPSTPYSVALTVTKIEGDIQTILVEQTLTGEHGNPYSPNIDEFTNRELFTFNTVTNELTAVPLSPEFQSFVLQARGSQNREQIMHSTIAQAEVRQKWTQHDDDDRHSLEVKARTPDGTVILVEETYDYARDSTKRSQYELNPTTYELTAVALDKAYEVPQPVFTLKADIIPRFDPATTQIIEVMSADLEQAAKDTTWKDASDSMTPNQVIEADKPHEWSVSGNVAHDGCEHDMLRLTGKTITGELMLEQKRVISSYIRSNADALDDTPERSTTLQKFSYDPKTKALTALTEAVEVETPKTKAAVADVNTQSPATKQMSRGVS